MQNMFSGISPNDFWLMAEGAWRTVLMTVSAGVLATIVGFLLGLTKLSKSKIAIFFIDTFTDIMRSVPLLVQVTVLYSGLNIAGFKVSVFMAGTIALGLFAAGYISEVVREAFLSVPVNLRRAARGLGMNRRLEYTYVVLPLGIAQAFPSWLGIILGIVKDTSVVAVIGYIELLRAAQNVITRTQDPLPILASAAAFYFIICFPISLLGRRLETVINKGAAI